MMRAAIQFVLALGLSLRLGAQEAKPLTLVAPAAPGGGWDQLARTMQRVLELIRVQIQHARRSSRRGKHAGGALRMKAAKKQTHGRGIAYARADFVARDHRGDHITTRGFSSGFGKTKDYRR